MNNGIIYKSHFSVRQDTKPDLPHRCHFFGGVAIVNRKKIHLPCLMYHGL
jgi:hypothetical protein